MAKLNVDVVAEDREVWRGEAEMVVVPVVDGELGLLPGHTPVLSALGKGQVRITVADGEKVIADVTGGFLSFDSDEVTVVADAASLSQDSR